MNGLEALLLRIDGMPQATIDEIEKATPAVAALIKTARANMPDLQALAALAVKAQPLLAKFAPLVQPALAEINTMLPAAQDVVAFLNSQSQKAAAPPPSPGGSSGDSD